MRQSALACILGTLGRACVTTEQCTSKWDSTQATDLGPSVLLDMQLCSVFVHLVWNVSNVQSVPSLLLSIVLSMCLAYPSHVYM